MEGYRQDVGRAASSMSVPSDLSDCSPRALIRKVRFRQDGWHAEKLLEMIMLTLQVALSRRRLPSCGDFVGDQTGASITASSLRDISGTLFHEFRKAADQGLTSYYLNQNIKLISFWRPWMLEADGPAWIRSCLASRGFKTEICKVYHTAYAGVQGCSFFELKVSW
ncbi:unnamed protein product [Durusdinium trenchii]|uniref:Uncharacterized protein n=1 Tax=Durusdinium trenchii TaxID=1381693 RepID=A0ABP0LDS1_9DINO